MSASYTVVTNNFIATPRDGYYEFANVAEDLKVDTYVEYAQSFIDYAKSVESLEPVPADRASTQVWASADSPVIEEDMENVEEDTVDTTEIETYMENTEEEKEDTKENETEISDSGGVSLGVASTFAWAFIAGTTLL